MIPKHLIPSLILIAGTAAAVSAMDGAGRDSDLRLEGILLPESYDFDITADSDLGSVSSDGDADFDQPFRIGVAAVSHRRGADSGPLGLVVGGALYYSRLESDEDSDTVLQSVSGQVRVGLGIYLGDLFHVEATPFAGIGGARGDNGSSESDVGLYWEYGVSAGAFATLDGGFQLGLIGGWLHGEYDLDFDDDENGFPDPVEDVNVEVQNEGFFVGISLGVRR